MSAIVSAVGRFIQKHVDPTKPVVLALSGGADSLTLLHLLLLHRSQMNLHIAHVDHRWRPESTDEARQLESLARSLSLPFHLKTLDPKATQGNLEAACREERLSFYRQVCRDLGAQAVFVAHHANDQAETVLTRVLEGHAFPYLQGMRPIFDLAGLILWRPLLPFTKAELLAWLQQQPQLMAPFQDNTNLDSRFNRGRLRTVMMPALEQSFGKDIVRPLCRLADEAQDLRDYFDEMIGELLSSAIVGPFGVCLDLSHQSIPDVFMSYLVRTLCERHGVILSTPIANTVCQLLQAGVADKKVSIDNRVLIVDRSRLFLLTMIPEAEMPPLRLCVGSHQYGPWTLNIEETSNPIHSSTWRDLWQGKARYTIPRDGVVLGPPVLSAPYPGNTPIRKWWSDHKVPAFLRPLMPVAWCDSRITAEFLTGRPPLASSNYLSLEVQSYLCDT